MLKSKYLSLFILTTFCYLNISQAQDSKGYIVLLEGDTLIGNVKISRTKSVKFYQNGKVDVYPKSELLDYGYFSSKKYISKPEKIPPSRKETILSDMIMATGDTINGCYLKKCDIDFLEIFVEYPRKEIFAVTEGKVKEVILYQDSFIMHIDAIDLMHNERKGDYYPGYAIRSINGKLRLYNGRSPFSKVSTLSKIGKILFRPLVIASMDFIYKDVILSKIDKWIVYKDGKRFGFNNFNEWEKIRTEMFANDIGFDKFLLENQYNQLSIETVLHAYNLYWEELNE